MVYTTYMSKILRECLRTARKILKRHPNKGNYPHFSFIVQGGRIVEYGWNTYRIPPVHYGYKKGTTHSEIDAYRKARGIMDDGKFVIVNIRLNKHGEMRLSAPCELCYTIMKELGCGEFYFSTDCGFARMR